MHFLWLLFVLSYSAVAQTSQPAQESDDDLRNSTIVFSIENVDKNKTIWLERNATLDYFLKVKGKNIEKVMKLSSKDASSLDRGFASKFLKCQYELGAGAEGCEVTLRLTMKGESQNVCEKEEKKTQEITPFYKELETRF